MSSREQIYQTTYWGEYNRCSQLENDFICHYCNKLNLIGFLKYKLCVLCLTCVENLNALTKQQTLDEKNNDDM